MPFKTKELHTIKDSDWHLTNYFLLSKPPSATPLPSLTMDSLLEFNEWFATMNLQGSEHSEHSCESAHPEAADCSSFPAKTSTSRSLHRSASFHDLETGLCEFELNDKDDEEDPSLTDTSISSNGSDLSSSSLAIEEDCCVGASPARRRLTFDHKVEVREYCVTVGDHPACSDELPLSLDWCHAPAYFTDIQHSKNRGFYYQAPRRLSLQDRCKRLSKVADYSDEILDALVYCSRHPPAATTASRGTLSLAKRMLWSTLQLSWRVATGLDQQDDADVEEEEYIWTAADDLEDDNDDLEEEKEGVVLVWERNHDLQWSQSLHED